MLGFFFGGVAPARSLNTASRRQVRIGLLIAAVGLATGVCRLLLSGGPERLWPLTMTVLLCVPGGVTLAWNALADARLPRHPDPGAAGRTAPRSAGHADR